MWQLIYEKSPWPEKPKLSRNLVSAAHSVLAVILLAWSDYIKYEIIVLNSISYFIWDLIYMSRFRLEPVYVFHHMVAIWALLSNVERAFLYKMIYYGELSNFPMYVVYHCLHSNIECFKLKIFQALWYPYFRIYKFTQLIIKYFKFNLLYYNLIGLYLMGIYWSGIQLKNLIK